jgi:hypothetical protein
MMSRIESKFDSDVEQTLREASWLLGEHPLFHRSAGLLDPNRRREWDLHRTCRSAMNQLEALKRDVLEAGYGSADASSTEHG